jgi:hypothetical protein
MGQFIEPEMSTMKRSATSIFELSLTTLAHWPPEPPELLVAELPPVELTLPPVELDVPPWPMTIVPEVPPLPFAPEPVVPPCEPELSPPPTLPPGSASPPHATSANAPRTPATATIGTRTVSFVFIRMNHLRPLRAGI